MTDPLAPERVLAELIAVPSASSLSNAPLIGCVLELLQPLGWHCSIHSYVDPAGIEKQNLIASPLPQSGETAHAELAVVCHTDTVPPDPGWKQAVQAHQENGSLHGLGACDVKGFLACMIATAHRLHAVQLQRPLCFVFTSDEEIGCRGAQFLCHSKLLTARYAIVGEPTSLAPATGGKGYCLAAVTVLGRPAHSAYPDAGSSAILAAARLITAIELLGQQLKSDCDERFSPPYTTLNIGTIQGGTAKNVVPAVCRFLLEWRPIPSQSPSLVADRVRALAQAAPCNGADSLQIQIEILREDPGFTTPPDSPVVQALLAEASGPLQTIAFGTEAPWLARMGADAVVIGPGSMLTAHSPRECVPIAELHRCTDLLERVIVNLCA